MLKDIVLPIMRLNIRLRNYFQLVPAISGVVVINTPELGKHNLTLKYSRHRKMTLKLVGNFGIKLHKNLLFI